MIIIIHTACMNVWNAIGVLYSIGRHVKGCVVGIAWRKGWVCAWVWITIGVLYSRQGSVWGMTYDYYNPHGLYECVECNRRIVFHRAACKGVCLGVDCNWCIVLGVHGCMLGCGLQ
jgi:hypothetical protein